MSCADPCHTDPISACFPGDEDQTDSGQRKRIYREWESSRIFWSAVLSIRWTDGIKDKIALFCNVPSDHVLQNLDVEYLYEAPLAMEEENLAGVVCECLKLDCPEPDLKDWTEMVECLKHPNTRCNSRPGRQIYPAPRCLYQCCRSIETRRHLQPRNGKYQMD